MDKDIKKYRNNLFVIFVCYVVVVIFNTHLFTMESIIPFAYGIFLVVLSVLTLSCLVLIDVNIVSSVKIAFIISPIIILSPFVGDFIYIVNLITNFRITGWFFIICGVFLFNTGRKILKLNS